MSVAERALIDTTLYIACLRLDGRRCVVVGGGPVGLEKVEGLLACDAGVTLVSPEAVPELERYLFGDAAAVTRDRWPGPHA